MVSTLERELDELEAVTEAASGLIRAPLPPRYAAASEPLLVEATAGVVAAADHVLTAWRKYCARVAGGPGDDADGRAVWRRMVRGMVRMLGTTSRLSARVTSGAGAERSAKVEGLMGVYERLAAGLAAAADDESWLALAVEWHPLDAAAFDRMAQRRAFVPPQEMLDEDWSALDPAPKP